MRFFIFTCTIFVVVLSHEDQNTLTEEERNLIRCCFQNLDCCHLEPTNFEVRALLVKCHKPEIDLEKRKNIVTVRKIRSEEDDHQFELKGGLPNCKKKIKLTVKIKNVGLTNCKNQYILINHVFDSLTGQRQQIFNPYVIKINQEPILETYGLCYESMVNALAKETVYNKNTAGYEGCNVSNPTCRTISYENQEIPYSSGFCCPCNTRENNLNDMNFPDTSKQSPYAFLKQANTRTLDYYNKTNLDSNGNKISNIQKRGGQDCNDKYTPPNVDPEAYHASTHCLKFSDLWYFVYRLKKPKIQHSLYLQIFQKYQTLESGCKWKDLTRDTPIRVGTDTKSYVNDEGSVVVHYIITDVNEINFGLNYNFHKLLIPDTSNVEDIDIHPEVQGGPDEYLVIKSNKVQSNGKTCNVAGVGYEAFSKQPNRCGMVRGSCLKNQPFHMWEEDNQKQLKGKKGDYFLKYFGVLSDNSLTPTSADNKTVSLLFTKSHTSMLDIEIEDDDNTILRANSLAAITEVYVDGTATQKNIIIAKVVNTGLVSSVFYVALIDCPLSLPASFSHITSMPALIPAQHQQVFKLDIQCPLIKQSFFCSLQILNMKKELIAIRKIRLERSDRCICTWYCSCTCYTADDGLKCEVLSLLAYHAAGFQGSMPLALQVVEYSFTDYLVSMMMYIVLTLCVTLLLMGIIKALLGLCVVAIGLWGLDVILDLPRKINKYYERDISHRRIIYDEYGWPVHPDTRSRVRNIPLQAEFCINVIFFVIYPFCVVYTVARKTHFSAQKDYDYTTVEVCYCKYGKSVKIKNSGLQNSLTKRSSNEKNY